MKATIVTMTKELAKDYLNANVENRSVKKSSLSFYKNQMNEGKWKENGECIIIDTNGVIKDGQHRLLAVEATGFSYRVPVVSGVNPDVMDTIDTGTNRSAGDILELNKFKYPRLLASVIKMIITNKLTDSNSKVSNTSNADILKYGENKKKHLEDIGKEATILNNMQMPKVLYPAVIGYYVYTYGNTSETIDFLKNICGIIRRPNTATDYVFKKLVRSKNGDARLSLSEKNQYIEKAYLYYVKGNHKVTSMKINKLNK
jgi:hypothetical protein